ncbi:MAG: hypothetical protein KDA51_05555, partial [Planctomycetales bacterium]|nr:hypothetical protein [Planctomycetales bacterium]
LHRLSGFGMLVGFRQSDGVELIDLLLATGILRQQEVNRNRPTVSVAPQLADPKLRTELLSTIVFPAKLESKLVNMLRKAKRVSQPPAVAPSPSKKALGSGPQTSGPPASLPPTSSHPQPAQTRTPPAPPSLGSQARPPRTGMFDFAEFDAEHGAIAHRHTNSSDERSVSGGQADKPTRDGPIGGADGSPTGIPTREAKPDWQWTLALFKAGHSWAEVTALRRMSDSELAESLTAALAGGGCVDRSWLASSSDRPRTAGQQRVVHEIRRKSAAWTN